jgi:hypothetical protein
MIDKVKAIQLRQEGNTYEAIANILNCSVAWCKKNLTGIEKNSIKPVETKPKRFIRTCITNEDGTITAARLNIATGEIKPFRYDKPELIIIPKGVMNTTKDPFWMSTPIAGERESITERQLRISQENKSCYKLTNYVSLEDAKEDFTFLDNLLVGVSNLGSSNEVSHNLMFGMLRDLSYINFESIKTYTGFSDTFCHKLATQLRVLDNAFSSAITKNNIL